MEFLSTLWKICYIEIKLYETRSEEKHDKNQLQQKNFFITGVPRWVNIYQLFLCDAGML